MYFIPFLPCRINSKWFRFNELNFWASEVSVLHFIFLGPSRKYNNIMAVCLASGKVLDQFLVLPGEAWRDPVKDLILY